MPDNSKTDPFFQNTIYLQTILEKSISSGDYDGVVSSIRDGAGPNYRVGSQSPLVLAVRHGHLEIMLHLLQSGADISFVNYNATSDLEPYTPTLQAYELMMADSLTFPNRWTRGAIFSLVVIAGIARAAGGIMIRNAVFEHNKEHPLHTVRCDGPQVISTVQKASQNQETMMLCLLEHGLFSELAVADPGFAAADSLTDVFLHAVRNGQANVVIRLLDMGADINMDVTGYGTTALYEAIRHHDLKTTKLLISRGADINCVPTSLPAEQGRHRAYRRGSYNFDDRSISPIFASLGPSTSVGSNEETVGYQLLKFLLEKGLDVNCRNTNGQTPLAVVVDRGSVLETELLLSFGADPDIEDSKGRIPLHLPAWGSGNVADLVRLLAPRTRNINHQDHDGNTPLIELVRNDGNLEAVKLLLAAGASSGINLFSAQKGTALQNSTYYCTTEMMGALLDTGADPNLVRGDAQSPLMGVASVRTRGPLLIGFLLARGANAAYADDRGNTALHIVVETHGENAVESARLLVQHGADVNAAREPGCGFTIRIGQDDPSPITPLLLAVDRRIREMAELLLENGADQRILSPRARDILRAILMGEP